ncbi:TPA: DMT family transporter [Providencia rettgeri]
MNHIVGFLFLTFIVVVLNPYQFNLSPIPLIAFIGGVNGAFFVVINSYVLPILGGMLTSILAICGQMISSLVIDIINGIQRQNLYLQLIGVLIKRNSTFINRSKTKLKGLTPVEYRNQALQAA